MDTTYFKRSFGIMVLMDSISGKAGVSNKFTAQNPRKPYATRL